MAHRLKTSDLLLVHRHIFYVNDCYVYVLIFVFILLQPLRWCCVDCVIQLERDVREEQQYIYTWRERAIIE